MQQNITRVKLGGFPRSAAVALRLRRIYPSCSDRSYARLLSEAEGPVFFPIEYTVP